MFLSVIQQQVLHRAEDKNLGNKYMVRCLYRLLRCDEANLHVNLGKTIQDAG